MPTTIPQTDFVVLAVILVDGGHGAIRLPPGFGCSRVFLTIIHGNLPELLRKIGQCRENARPGWDGISA